MGNEVLTLQEVAELLGKSTQTVRRMIKKGDLKAQRIRTAQGFQYGIYRTQLESNLTRPVVPSFAPSAGYSTTSHLPEKPLELAPIHLADEAEKAFVEAAKPVLTSQVDTAEKPTREPLMTRDDVVAFLDNDYFEVESHNEQPTLDVQRLLEMQHREKMLLIHILEALQAELRAERARPKSILAWILKKMGF